MKTLNKYSYDPFISLSLFILIFYQINGFTWVSELLLSFGIPYLRFQKFFFLYIPFAYIIVRNIRNNKIKLNNSIFFLLFCLVHYMMEHFLYGNNYFPSDSIELIEIWTSIFIGYLALINTPIQYQIKIINYFIFGAILIFSIVYIDLLTSLDIASISTGQDDFSGRLYSTLNLNIVCDIGAFSILLIYYLKYNFNKSNFYGVPYLLIAFFFIALMFLQASRGSILLLLLVILGLILKNNYSLIISFITVITFLFLMGYSLTQVNLINRITNQKFSEVEALRSYDGRYLQIISSYNNFLKSPIVGVGYKNAAKGYYHGISRSNFQYTQILAAGGLFLFILYFFMIFRFFSSSLKLIMNDDYVWMFLCFILLYFTFRRPNAFFSIILYLAYCRKLYVR